jgi:hypothetical protein
MPKNPHPEKLQTAGEAPKGGDRWAKKEAWKKLPGNRYTPEELAIMDANSFSDIYLESPQSAKTTVVI